MGIRIANVKDAGLVADLVAKLLTELNGSPYEKEAFLETTKSLLEGDRYTVYLAYSGMDCVGMISVCESFAIHTSSSFGVIQELYVSPNMRSLNIGAELLNTVREHARNNNWNRIDVGAPDSHKWGRTISFYKREGFVEVGPRLKLRM